MRATKMNKTIAISKLLPVLALLLPLLCTAPAHASAPGITGGTGATATFHLTAQTAFLNQPDGNAVYSWGYGCDPNYPQPGFAPAAIPDATCNSMQVPGPTLIVTEGQVVTVTLSNGLPTSAGNTSIMFPGFTVTAANGVPGLLAQEALPGGTVTYTFTATSPGTHSYYSGTQGDLQIEMGLYGAIIVLPAQVPSSCNSVPTSFYEQPTAAPGGPVEHDFRLAKAAYDHPKTCYDREYLFQWAEMDPSIHTNALAQVTATNGCTAGSPGCSLNVPTEPYHPSYYLINGRSMPDLMDANYAAEYPHQPYNGNPHMHPGEQVLIRAIGQGRWQHPFHEHGNHVRILGRDGSLILTPDGADLAGLLMFNTDTTPGQAFEGIYYWSGRGLNWDAYGHHAKFTALNTNPPANTTLNAAISTTATKITVASGTSFVNGFALQIDNEQMILTAGGGGTTLTVTRGANGTVAATHLAGAAVTSNADFNPNGNVFTATGNEEPPCIPDANGYYTVNSNPPAPRNAINYYEWCQDHNKPLEVAAAGDIGSGGPATLPDPNIFTNGAWYSGSPYLGPDATTRATGPTSSFQPSNSQANPADERGYAFMWHSHNEREITTNNVFPGGMLMMMLVDSREFVIDESK